MSLVALLDIGSTSVSGILLDGKTKKVICLKHQPITFQERLDTDRFLGEISAAAKSVLASLAREAGKAPSETHCFLSAPFYAARTTILEKKDEKPFVFSDKILASMVAGASEKIADHEILESEVLDIRLNGYKVANPYGQKTREVSIGHYLSIASSRVLAQLPEGTKFHSFSYVLYRIMSKLLPNDPNYLVLDIGGEISELSLIWDGIMRETVSYPIGENWLLRKIPQSELNLYLENKCDQVTAKKVESLLVPLREEWRTNFKQALDRALENSFLPSNIYLAAAPAAARLFSRWLAEEPFHNLVLGDKNLRVSILDQNFFAPLGSYSQPIKDVPLLVETIFYDRII